MLRIPRPLGRNENLPPIVVPDIVNQSPLREQIIRCYEENWGRYIRTHETSFAFHQRFNFELSDQLPLDDVLTREIYQRQQFVFRVNASIGSILINTQNNQTKYYWSCWNNHSLFDIAPMISDNASWQEFLRRLAATDYFEEASRGRSDR